MTAAMAMPGNTAETFLVHFFGTGLADDRYVVERYRARAEGDIVPAPAEVLAAKGRRKAAGRKTSPGPATSRRACTDWRARCWRPSATRSRQACATSP